MGKRIEWIDIAKGIGILLVILGHAGIPDNLYTIIYSFHMPLFFFLSGCTFNRNVDFATFLKKKFKTIVIPYVWGGILYIPYVLMVSGDNINIIEVATSFVKDYLININFDHFWFITALFWCNIIYYLLEKLINNKYILVLISMLCFGIGVAYTHCCGYLPWNINLAFTAIIFFHMGKGFIKSNLYNKLFTINNFYYVMSLVVWIILLAITVILNNRISFRKCEWGIIPFSILLAFYGIGMTIYFSSKIHIKALSYLGKNSIIYYMFHPIGFEVTYKVFAILSINPESIPVIYFICKMAITMVLLSVGSYILNKPKLRYVLGRF